MIVQPDADIMRQHAQPLVVRAQGIVIQNAAQHEQAMMLVRDLTAMEKKIVAHHEEMKSLAHKTWRSVCTQEKKLLGPVQEAKRHVSLKAGAYEEEKRREAEAEERRRQEEARKLQEKRLLEEAAQAEANGDTQEAEAILEEAITEEVPMVTVEPEVAKVEGVSSRKTYSAEVTDLKKLVQYIAANPQWINCVVAHMPTLNSLARAQKEAFNMPGVKVVAKRSMAVRSW